MNNTKSHVFFTYFKPLQGALILWSPISSHGGKGGLFILTKLLKKHENKLESKPKKITLFGVIEQVW